MKLKTGLLIVFEGIDGSGKTTQARSLIRRLRAAGVRAVRFREPSRGRWGREIKRLARRADSLKPEEELDLFLKDRRENVELNIRPAMARREVVVLDRYYYSTIAYQGAKGLDPERIRRLNERFAVRPDLVIVLDLGPEKGLARISGRRTRDELFERRGYLARVRAIFRSFSGRRFVHLDARRGKRDLSREVWGLVEPLLKRARKGLG